MRTVTILAIICNTTGVLLIKFVIPKDVAVTYDITPYVIFTIMCSIALLIYLNLAHVTFNPKQNELQIKTIRRNFKIESNQILKVKRTTFLLCEVIYKDGNSSKTLLFQPSIRQFFPFHDFPEKVRELLHD